MGTCWRQEGSAGISLWDLLDLSAPPKTVYENRDVDIIKVAFSPDGHWLVAGATETYQVLLFHTPFDSPPLSFHVNQWVGTLAFSPDKHWLVVPDHYDAVVVDLNKANPISEPIILRGHKDAIADMAFSPDGLWFATGSADHSVQLWNVPDRFSGPTVLRGHEGPISSLAFDGEFRGHSRRPATTRRYGCGMFLRRLANQYGCTRRRIRRDCACGALRERRSLPVRKSRGDELGVGAGRCSARMANGWRPSPIQRISCIS